MTPRNNQREDIERFKQSLQQKEVSVAGLSSKINLCGDGQYKFSDRGRVLVGVGQQHHIPCHLHLP